MPQAATPIPGPIRINGHEISDEAIRRELPFHPAPSARDAWQRSALALSVRALLLDEAERLGIAENAAGAEDEIISGDDARIAELLDRELRCPEPSAQECRTWYDNNPRRFTAPSEYRVAHILVPAPPGDLAARRHALRRCQRLLRLLTKAPERFAELALGYSRCPSAAQGGSLGVIGPGQTCPEFEQALGHLPVGAIAPEPIETRFGWHVVLVQAATPGRPLSFDEVQDTIARYLNESVRRRAIAQYVRILAGRAQIEGIDLAAADSPLVQ